MRWLMSVLLLLLLFAFGTQARAVIPHQVLLDLRDSASDVIHIQVMDFQESASEDCAAPCKQHDVQAKVLSVVRSQAGLKAGQIIKIRYTHTSLKPGDDGAQPTIAPSEGSKSCAYLTGSVENGFSPVAKSSSFPSSCQ